MESERNCMRHEWEWIVLTGNWLEMIRHPIPKLLLLPPIFITVWGFPHVPKNLPIHKRAFTFGIWPKIFRLNQQFLCIGNESNSSEQKTRMHNQSQNEDPLHNQWTDVFLKPLDRFGKMGVSFNFPMSLQYRVTLTTKSDWFLSYPDSELH